MNDLLSHATTQVISNPVRAAARRRGRRAGVTVSIPCFGYRDTLRRAVESILGQTHRELTAFVVNDGDAPPWDVLADIDDPRLVRFDLAENRGCYFAHALVLAASRDPFLLIQDADDWSEPERVASLLAALEAESAAGAVSSVLVHEADGAASVHRFPDVRRPLPDRMRFLAPHHGLFRTAALREIGGYGPGFRVGYDALLCNLVRMTGGIAYVDEPLYHRTKHADSLTTSASTGFHSRHRQSVNRRLRRIYEEAHAAHALCADGVIDALQLRAFIRHLATHQVPPEVHAALRTERKRLDRLLQTAAEHRPVPTNSQPRQKAVATSPPRRGARLDKVVHLLFTRSAYEPKLPLHALQYRLDLTRCITARSLASQTNRDFIWVVRLSESDPLRDERRALLRSLPFPVRFLIERPVGTAGPDRSRILRGGWSEAVRELADGHADVATTRIDDDDAFSRDALERIRSALVKSDKPLVWFQPHGYVCSGGVVRRVLPNNQFATFQSPAGGAKHVWSCPHPLLGELGQVREVDQRPAWLWYRHPWGLSFSAAFGRQYKRLPEEVERAELEGSFDIDWLGVELAERYRRLCEERHNICEHLPVLRQLAAGCRHVTEFGVQRGRSTTALLASGTRLVSYDIVRRREVDELMRLAGGGFTFHQADTRAVHIAETDLLFIDTQHSYEQLQAELTRHAGRVRRWIVCHDTITYGHRDAPDTPARSARQGPQGLVPAIEEFVAAGGWRIHSRSPNNHGMTILERSARGSR